MTPHKVLGLHFNATKEDATSAYRREAKKCHPDLHPNDIDAADRFAKLNDAYNSVLEQIDRPSSRDRGPVRKNEKPLPTYITIRRNVFLSVSEAINGCNKTLEGISGPCGTCEGQGKVPTGNPVECTSCYGSGSIFSKSSGFINLKVECSDCKGGGKVGWFICYECGGFGTQNVNPCDVDIPPGSRHGDKLIVPGGANDKKENVVGDVEINIVIRDKKFRIVGNDVEALVPLDIWDATLGCKITVPLPVGGSFRLTIPEETASGARFRVAGKGLNYTEEKGDMVVVIHIKPLRLSKNRTREAMLILRDEVL